MIIQTNSKHIVEECRIFRDVKVFGDWVFATVSDEIMSFSELGDLFDRWIRNDEVSYIEHSHIEREKSCKRYDCYLFVPEERWHNPPAAAQKMQNGVRYVHQYSFPASPPQQKYRIASGLSRGTLTSHGEEWVAFVDNPSEIGGCIARGATQEEALERAARELARQGFLDVVLRIYADLNTLWENESGFLRPQLGQKKTLLKKLEQKGFQSIDHGNVVRFRHWREDDISLFLDIIKDDTVVWGNYSSVSESDGYTYYHCIRRDQKDVSVVDDKIDTRILRMPIWSRMAKGYHVRAKIEYEDELCTRTGTLVMYQTVADAWFILQFNGSGCSKILVSERFFGLDEVMEQFKNACASKGMHVNEIKLNEIGKPPTEEMVWSG